MTGDGDHKYNWIMCDYSFIYKYIYINIYIKYMKIIMKLYENNLFEIDNIQKHVFTINIPLTKNIYKFD